MTHDEALDRVQKLLRLAKSDNANEAAVAMAMAQKLMDLHKFDMASVEGSEVKENIENHIDNPLESKFSTWKGRLAMVIAKNNNCKVYVQNSKLILIGKKSDTQTVRYMYQWLANETERLVGLEERGMGRVWYNNFRLGVVEILSERLRDQKAKTEAEARANAVAANGENGLANVNKAIIKVNEDMAAVIRWTKDNMRLRKHVEGRSQYDNNARQAGREAGATVGLGGSNRGLNAGRLALKA